MCQSQNRQQDGKPALVFEDLIPCLAAEADAPQKAPGPAIPPRDCLVLFDDKPGNEDQSRGSQRPGDKVPVAHGQIQEFPEFRFGGERTRTAAPDLIEVRAGRNRHRPADERCEETVHLFEIHGAFPGKASEDRFKTVAFRIRERLVQGGLVGRCHGDRITGRVWRISRGNCLSVKPVRHGCVAPDLWAVRNRMRSGILVTMPTKARL